MKAPCYGVVVAPYERTTSHFQGAALGPGELLEEWMELCREEGFPPPGRVATIGKGDLSGPSRATAALGKETAALIDEGLLPLVLGGEHTVTLGAFEGALSQCGPLGLVHLDAHADLRPRYGGSPFSHASVMRRIVERTGVPHMPVGVRALSREEAAFLENSGRGWLPGSRLREWPALLPPLLDALPPSVYLTVDMDFFDPSAVPGVGTPEPGGAGWYDALGIVETLCARKRLVAFDVVELCPPRERERSLRAAARFIEHILRHAGESGGR